MIFRKGFRKHLSGLRRMPDQAAILPELSVVIPIYKNSETLEELYRRLSLSVQSLNVEYEILFINDASPDNSLSILNDLAFRDPNVGIVSLGSNIGQHPATLIGLRYARGKYALSMDADLQDPPEAIPDLWHAIKGTPRLGVVFAGKSGKYESQNRLAAAFVFKHFLHWICGTPYDAGGFCLMNREVIMKLRCFPVKRAYLLSMIGSCQLPMKSIPVSRRLRPVGESSYTNWQRFRLGCYGIWIALNFKWKKILQEYTPAENELPILSVTPPRLTQKIATDI